VTENLQRSAIRHHIIAAGPDLCYTSQKRGRGAQEQRGTLAEGSDGRVTMVTGAEMMRGAVRE
jgi:hypothetical protein